MINYDNIKNYIDLPLWAVYGYYSFPSIIACTINDHPQCGLTIWGYSEWKNKPAYRTLGQDLQKWMIENNGIFFDDHDEALQYIKKLTTPKRIKNA